MLVGSHIASRPSAIAASASSGRSQACATTSPPSRLGSTPSGSGAAKKRASNRRGRLDGVTQRDSGISRSVRRRRSSSAATDANVASPRSSADRAASTAEPARPTSASSTPASSKHSRMAATNAAMAASGARSPPRAAAASAGVIDDARRARGRRRPASTRPPGKTCMSGANAIVDGRWVRSASSPAAPCRSRTTVAAGRGSTGRLTVGSPSTPWRPAQRAAPAGSVTGSRQTNPRQT